MTASTSQSVGIVPERDSGSVTTDTVMPCLANCMPVSSVPVISSAMIRSFVFIMLLLYKIFKEAFFIKLQLIRAAKDLNIRHIF